jgi:hypothetical protein
MAGLSMNRKTKARQDMKKTKYFDYIIESFRFEYCERYVIQAKNLNEALTTAKKEKNLIVDENCYLVV